MNGMLIFHIALTCKSVNHWGCVVSVINYSIKMHVNLISICSVKLKVAIGNVYIMTSRQHNTMI